MEWTTGGSTDAQRLKKQVYWGQQVSASLGEEGGKPDTGQQPQKFASPYPAAIIASALSPFDTLEVKMQ